MAGFQRFPQLPSFPDIIHRGDDHQRKHGGGYQSSHHGRGDPFHHLRTGLGPPHHRQKPDERGGDGHQLGSHPFDGPLNDGRMKVLRTIHLIFHLTHMKSFIQIDEHDHAGLGCKSCQRNKSHHHGHGNIISEEVKQPHASHQRKRKACHHHGSLGDAVEMDVEQDEDYPQRHRNNHIQGLSGFFHVLILPRPHNGISGGKINLPIHHRFGLFHIRPHIHAPQIHIYPGSPAGVFALDARGSFVNGQIRQLGQRNLRARGCGHKNASEPLNVIPEFAVVPQTDRVSLQPFNCVGHVHPADSRHDHILHISNRQPVPCNMISPNIKVKIISARDPLRIGRKSAWNLLNHRLNSGTQFREDIQIRAHKLDSHRRLDPGGEHVNPGFDGHGPRVGQPRKLNGPVKVLSEFVNGNIPFLGPEPRQRRSEPAWPVREKPSDLFLPPFVKNLPLYNFRPEPRQRLFEPARPVREKPVHRYHLIFRVRPEHDGRLDHGEGRGIGGRFGPSDFAEGMAHLREPLDDLICLLEQFLGLGHGDARKRRGHIEKVAFIQGRHKFASQLGRGIIRDRHHEHRQQNCGFSPFKHPFDQGKIKPDKKSAQRILRLRYDLLADETQEDEQRKRQRGHQTPVRKLKTSGSSRDDKKRRACQSRDPDQSLALFRDAGINGLLPDEKGHKHRNNGDRQDRRRGYGKGFCISQGFEEAP